MSTSEIAVSIAQRAEVVVNNNTRVIARCRNCYLANVIAKDIALCYKVRSVQVKRGKINRNTWYLQCVY